MSEPIPMEFQLPLQAPMELVGPVLKGETGEGVPAGGTTGQILAKASGADYDSEWVDNEGGSGTTRRILSVKVVATANRFPGFSAGVWPTDYNGSDDALAIDDYILQLGDRFLLANQTSGTGNGVCVMVATTGGRFKPEPLDEWNYLGDSGLQLSSLDLVLVENGSVGQVGSVWELRGNNTSRLLSPTRIYTPSGVLPENIELPFLDYSGLLSSSETLRAAMFVLDALSTGNVPDGGTTGQALKKLSNADQDFGWVDDATGGGGGGGSSVSITGTATQAMAANATYTCTATSSDYTVTMTTSALSAGDVVTFVFPAANTKLVTLFCAGGIAGDTTRVMRDGESAVLLWTGSTFERRGGLNQPFLGGLNSTTASTVTTGAENRITLNRAITGLNPGYGLVVTTSNGSLVVPRTGRYKLKIALRVDGSTLASNANRIYAFFRLNATAGTYLNNSEASVLAGSYAFVPGDSPVLLNAGDVLTLYCGTSVSFNNSVGGGDFDNTWVSIEEIPPW